MPLGGIRPLHWAFSVGIIQPLLREFVPQLTKCKLPMESL